MRRLENFVKIVLLTIIMLVLLFVADILILTFWGLRSDADFSAIPQSGLSVFEEQLEKKNSEEGVRYSLSQQGMDWIDSFDGFAFLLDGAGDVVWSYQLPDDVPAHYAIRDIVRFSKYYLNDYPVYTRIIDDTVLVIGLPRQTVWKYNFSLRIGTVDMFAAVLPVLFVINVVVLLIGPFWIIRHDAHKREMQRTSWIAGVSHDIRTPLSLVLGYADELLRSAENDMEDIDRESVAGKARMIEHQALRIKTLVTNLNTSNKLTYGMGTWRRETVLLPALIREVICGIINRKLDDKYDISVIISEELEQFCVSGDSELIKRFVENLINNAINHNPQGCAITVSLTRQNLWIYKRIVFEISDNGCGVSRQQLRQFRGSIRSDKLPEHGLGIRLVRQIVSFHHWRIHFLNGNEGGLCCRIFM